MHGLYTVNDVGVATAVAELTPGHGACGGGHAVVARDAAAAAVSWSASTPVTQCDIIMPQSGGTLQSILVSDWRYDVTSLGQAWQYDMTCLGQAARYSHCLLYTSDAADE